MERKLILTPTDQMYLYGYQDGLKRNPLSRKDIPIDVIHFFLSALTMAGADRIYSMLRFEETDTTLIKKVLKKPLIKDWVNCLTQVEESFKIYNQYKIKKNIERGLFLYKIDIIQLLFALKTNSSVLLFRDLQSNKYISILPPELTMPYDLIISSIQSKNAQLPIIKFDLQKKDIRNLMDVISSKEYNIYKNAHSEIEKSKNLTQKTISSIVTAGRDLYQKNSSLFTLKESLIKAIPLSSQVIEFCFGKLPGTIAEFATKLITDYLKVNNTISIYSANSISFLLKSHMIDKDRNDKKGSR